MQSESRKSTVDSRQSIGTTLVLPLSGGGVRSCYLLISDDCISRTIDSAAARESGAAMTGRPTTM